MTDSRRCTPPCLDVPESLGDFLLNTSEDRLRIAAGIASDLIYEWNITDDGLEWLGDIDKILGFEQGELPRTIEAWVGRIHPDDQKQLEGAVERHRTDTGPIHEEYRIQHKDGTWLHWMDRGVPVLDEQGRPEKWIGVCTDITEQKQAEESLLNSERRFREMAELLPEVIYELDASGRLTFVNQRAYEIFGYGPEDFERGVEVSDMLAPEDRERAMERISRLATGEEVGLSEYTGLRKDGTRFPVLLRSAPILRNGRIVGMRGVVMDVTAQKQASV